MIDLRNLSYSYPGANRPALDGINLRIAAGEAVCVMGSNGSGKSTLARIIAGLLQPTSGACDIDVNGDCPIPVGMLFQNPENQMVAVTVEKEIAFALENMGKRMSEMEDSVSEVLRRLDIEHLRLRLTSELSGGERQRVALASLMVFNPPVLVLDEPDSFLDQRGRSVLRDELDRIHRLQSRIVEVRITQYARVAEQYDRLVVLQHGRVAADGPPGEVFDDAEFAAELGIRWSEESGPPNGEFPRSFGTDRKGGPKRIVTRGLSYCYGTKAPIFRHLEFEWHRSEVVGIVGPSGSGKSTLGYLLCGATEPKTGDVEFVTSQGDRLTRSDIRGRVAAIFQQPERQFFLPTCHEEIEFGPANLGVDLEREEVESYFRLVGLDPDRFWSRDPFTLSGGEKRRLAFASVLSMQPDFIVFDEPTCGLDAEGYGRFVGLANSLRDAGVGLAIITHEGDLLHDLAQRLLVLPGDGSHSVVTYDEFRRNAGFERLVAETSPRNGTDSK